MLSSVPIFEGMRKKTSTDHEKNKHACIYQITMTMTCQIFFRIKFVFCILFSKVSKKKIQKCYFQ